MYGTGSRTKRTMEENRHRNSMYAGGGATNERARDPVADGASSFYGENLPGNPALLVNTTYEGGFWVG